MVLAENVELEEFTLTDDWGPKERKTSVVTEADGLPVPSAAHVWIVCGLLLGRSEPFCPICFYFFQRVSVDLRHSMAASESLGEQVFPGLPDHFCAGG